MTATTGRRLPPMIHWAAWWKLHAVEMARSPLTPHVAQFLVNGMRKDQRFAWTKAATLADWLGLSERVVLDSLRRLCSGPDPLLSRGFRKGSRKWPVFWFYGEPTPAIVAQPRPRDERRRKGAQSGTRASSCAGSTGSAIRNESDRLRGRAIRNESAAPSGTRATDSVREELPKSKLPKEDRKPLTPTRPRDAGTNPRAEGTNPRATGTNPRADRAREAADERRVLDKLKREHEPGPIPDGEADDKRRRDDGSTPGSTPDRIEPPDPIPEARTVKAADPDDPEDHWITANEALAEIRTDLNRRNGRKQQHPSRLDGEPS